MASLTVAMGNALLSPRRVLAWLFFVEGQSTDLYAWSGIHTLRYGGHSYLGVAHVAGMDTIRKSEDTEFVGQKLSLSGLDPTVVADLDTSVRGRTASIKLAALNEAGQVIADPLLLNELFQDNLGWDRASNDSVTLNLSCWESLPFVGRTTGDKWSYEGQLDAFSGDIGFRDNTAIALAGPAVSWQQG